MQLVAGILKQDVSALAGVCVIKLPEQRESIAAPHATADGTPCEIGRELHGRGELADLGRAWRARLPRAMLDTVSPSRGPVI